MNQYNFVFLLDEEKNEKDLKELISSVSGKVMEEKLYGKKNLAYEIKKNSQAYLFEWIIGLDKDKISEFKKKLEFKGKILRYVMFKSKEKKENKKSKITNNK
ncbi:MAG: 30S ribosomal protein S6 [bacterium]